MTAIKHSVSLLVNVCRETYTNKISNHRKTILSEPRMSLEAAIYVK